MRLCFRAGLALAFGGCLSAQPVDLVLIDGVREFPEATEPGAIRYACAESADPLRAFFAEQNLRFDERLLRPRPGYKACHIHYQPTLPGFRAAAENKPITGLYGAVDPVSFIGRRTLSGESLDVIRTLLGRVKRPLRLELRVNERFDNSYWPGALEHHFPDTPHYIGILPTPGVGTHPWAQDYIKSGAVEGELKILVPRRVFEGRGEDGEIHRPMLEGLQGDAFVRSKLSWEGGDTLFVQDPRDPSLLLMVYGNAAREYWGAALPPEDYEYVLATEFGADRALPIVGTAAHVDYLVSFPPPIPGKPPVALVSRRERENGALIRAALAELNTLYAPNPPQGLARLASLLRELDAGVAPDVGQVVQQIEVLRSQLAVLAPPAPEELSRELEAFVAEHCPGDSDSCFGVEGGREMMRVNPDLFRRTADLGLAIDYYERLAPRLLNLILSQLPGASAFRSEQVDSRAKELEKMGFRVVRIPRLLVDDRSARWQGVSYANLLAVDRMLFVPTFGLGKAEEDLLAQFQKRLGADYEVIRVPARTSLLNNGGIHCVFGIVREP